MDNTMNADTYIKLDAKYEYRIAHHAVFEINRRANRSCLLDLWWLADWNLTPEQEVTIAKRMVDAYEIGKNKKERQIKENILKAFKLATEED